MVGGPDEVRRLRLPESAIDLLKLQRTAYKALSHQEIETRYDLQIDEYLQAFGQYLPDGCSRALRIMDIGCGVGFGLLAMRRRLGPTHTYVAVDRDTPSTAIEYGFAETASAYNSLAVTRGVLTLNGLPDEQVETIDLDNAAIPNVRVDIVLSIMAWGFHFPVSTYLERVSALQGPGDLLLIDLRAGTEGADLLSADYDPIYSVRWQKADRMAWRKR